MEGCCNSCGGNVDTRVVRLTFKREELLYDIKNYAFVEADVMGEPGVRADDKLRHAQHQLADIGEAGNVDRVNRILAVVHTAVVDMLYPYTKEEPVEEEISDVLETPEEYVVVLTVPITVSRTTLQLLSKLIHEYMVYRVMADWLSITNPQASAHWMEKADATQMEIERTKGVHRRPLTRKMSTF